MSHYVQYLAIGFFTVGLACSPQRLASSVEGPANTAHPGMVKILSAGKSFQQGWNDTDAAPDEKPGMKSSFTYDYWMDTTEVSQKDYYDKTGKTPVSSGSAYGTGNGFPVYYVSWFDAVLYCNTRSKAEGLDTVYFFSGIKTVPNGTVNELTGLGYDIKRDGYRLPTEAEWEFAARGGTSVLPFSSMTDSVYALNSAWFGENSSGKTQAVGLKSPNALGLHDMAGNVFEWTNDWKGYYNGKDITNSLGAPEPDKEYEKVIKGGSYNYGLTYLRPSRRSVTYATTLSSANEYVGFRCARGPVSNGQYIGAVQSGLTSNPVTVTAGAGDVQTFAGTTAAKLVFVNVSGENRTLCCVDFSQTFPHVLEYLDDQNVYMPAISPDGRFAAYCSSDVGLSMPSEVTIRSLDSLNSPKTKLGPHPAYVPRWWIDQFAKDTFIVYTNSAVVNGNDALWRSTGTFLQKIKGGRPVGNPEEIVSDGSFHDGLSADKRYIVTGYTRLMMKDLVTNEEKQLFLSPENGKDADGSEQACNVSISPDTGSAVRCMFLDFGYPRISALTGNSYDVHQYIFVATMTDSITTFMHCPDGEQSWDNPQWSNHARFAVGCGRNSEDKAHAIYAIDIIKKNSMRIVTGAELQQPYLWTGATVENHSNFSIDSLGRYNDPSTSDVQFRLSVKFLMFWKVCQPLNIAVVGSSQAFMGIDPRLFTGGLTSFNLASPGNDFTGQKIMILNYILKHCPDIKLICSSFELFWLANPAIDSSWGGGLGQSKGYLYDSAHGFWPGAVTNDFKNIITQVPFAYPPDTSCSGFASCPTGNWGGNPPDFWGTPLWDTSDTNYKKNVAAIRMLADTLRLRGIHWLMINFPISPYYKNTDLYCWAGLLRSTAREIIQGMDELDSANEFFHFYDANMDGNHDYGDNDACDVSHLNGQGAEKLSVRVDSIIHSILGN